MPATASAARVYALHEQSICFHDLFVCTLWLSRCALYATEHHEQDTSSVGSSSRLCFSCSSHHHVSAPLTTQHTDGRVTAHSKYERNTLQRSFIATCFICTTSRTRPRRRESSTSRHESTGTRLTT